MDSYLKLILHGYANENPKDLTPYLIEQQKRAEKERHVKADEFFERCYDVINFFEKNLDEQLYKRKNELYLMRGRAENRTAKFGNENNGLTYDEQREQLIKYCDTELNNISRDNYSVHLFSLTNGAFIGHLWTGNINYIKQCIDEAKNRVTQAKNNETPRQETLGKNQKNVLKAQLFELSGLTPDNVETIYLGLYDRWRFDYSDEVWMNGKLLSKKDKTIIRLGGETDPGIKIEVSGMQDGFPLIEELFVREQLNKYVEIDGNTPYDENVRTEKNRLKTLLEFLSEKLKRLEKSQEPETVNPDMVNPHPGIFKDSKAFRLFEKLHNIYKDSKNLLADYSFIYRMMCEEGYILTSQKPEMFREWLCKEPFNIFLDNKFKALDRCKTDGKLNTYNIAKELIL